MFHLGSIVPHHSVTRVFTILLLLAPVAFAQNATPTISVTGEADMRVLADEIVIRASIESRAKTPAEACKDNREKTRQLIEFLKSNKIDEKLIDANLLSIDPILPESTSSSEKGGKSFQSDQDPFGDPTEVENPFGPRRRAIGYTAYRQFAIVVKDLKKFEDLYQGIVEKGINRVDSVTFRSSDEKANLEKLRLQAVRVAKQRAEAMANELGAELASIKSIEHSKVNSLPGESGMGMGSSRYGGMRSDPFGSDSPSSTDGQITLYSSVDVVFYLDSSKFKK